MSTKPYLFAYALAFGMGVPVLWYAAKPSVPVEPNPKVDARILSDLAFGGKGTTVPAIAQPQDKPAATDDEVHGPTAGHAVTQALDELRGGTNRAELVSLPTIKMDFGAKPGVPSHPLALPADDSAVWASQVGAVSNGDGFGLFAPPPIFGAFASGDFGGGGGGVGDSGTAGGGLPGGEYILVGPPGGFIGGSGAEAGDSGSAGGTDGSGDGGGLTGILYIGGGSAVPEPASWLLGFCAAALLVALRVRQRML